MPALLPLAPLRSALSAPPLLALFGATSLLFPMILPGGVQTGSAGLAEAQTVLRLAQSRRKILTGAHPLDQRWKKLRRPC